MLGAIAWIAAQAPAAPNDNGPEATPQQMATQDAIGHVERGALHTISENTLTVAIFAFGLLAFILLFLLVHFQKASPFVLRIYVITILIFGSLLVVSNAYTTAQLAPVIGLFGTIAGYVLGRGEGSNDHK